MHSRLPSQVDLKKGELVFETNEGKEWDSASSPLNNDKVAALLEKAGERDTPLHMTEVNYAELKYIVLRRDGAARWADVARDLPTLPIEFHPADRELADVAADFKSRFNLSLADAFAAALAKKHKAELVTGGPKFKAVEKEIKIHWLRQ